MEFKRIKCESSGKTDSFSCYTLTPIVFLANEETYVGITMVVVDTSNLDVPNVFVIFLNKNAQLIIIVISYRTDKCLGALNCVDKKTTLQKLINIRIIHPMYIIFRNIIFR